MRMDDDGTGVKKIKKSSVSKFDNTVKIFEEYEDGTIRLIIGFVTDDEIKGDDEIKSEVVQ
jgi:hypothetical protein